MTDKAKGMLLVILQFYFLILLTVFAGTDQTGWGSLTVAIRVVGLILLVPAVYVVIAGLRGLGKALAANPVPRDEGELVTSGIYARMRHPIYSGLMLAGLALVLQSGPMPHVLYWLALVVVLNVKVRFEERLLAAKYAGYHSYAAATPRFIPRLSR